MPSPLAAPTPWAALAAMLDERGPLPLVTFYDDASGERAELSVRSFENAVAKSANLLRDGLGLAAGARVGIRLPLHWQLPVWLAACWALGAVAAPGAAPGGCDVLVVGPDEVDPGGIGLAATDEVLAVSLQPFGMPFSGPLPPGVLDAAVEVRAHGDRFDGPAPDPRADALLLPDGTVLDQSGVLAAAEGVAVATGLGAGGRLLSARPPVDVPGLLATLAVPLAVGGSVVLVGHEDPAARPARMRDEHVTAVLA